MKSRRVALWLTGPYVVIAAIALFDTLFRGGLSSEDAAGLSLLAHVPAIPASILINLLLDANGLAWLLAPFESGLANIVWISVTFWVLAMAQWWWLLPAIRSRLSMRAGASPVDHK